MEVSLQSVSALDSFVFFSSRALYGLAKKQKSGRRAFTCVVRKLQFPRRGNFLHRKRVENSFPAFNDECVTMENRSLFPELSGAVEQTSKSVPDASKIGLFHFDTFNPFADDFLMVSSLQVIKHQVLYPFKWASLKIFVWMGKHRNSAGCRAFLESKLDFVCFNYEPSPWSTHTGKQWESHICARLIEKIRRQNRRGNQRTEFLCKYRAPWESGRGKFASQWASNFAKRLTD